MNSPSETRLRLYPVSDGDLTGASVDDPCGTPSPANDPRWLLADYADDLCSEGAESCRPTGPSNRMATQQSPAAAARCTSSQTQRLCAAMNGALAALNLDGAAVYMLDDATTELRMRAACGIEAPQWNMPPRPLAGAVADLEAMCGHAVVLEDDTLHESWRVPESCGSAVCVPLATHLTILGTFWLFCNTPRKFTDVETNLIEIVAGRLAYELELERVAEAPAAWSEGGDASHDATGLLRSQIPTLTPELDGIDLAGWTTRESGLTTSFHDWMVREDGRLIILVAATGDTQPSPTMANALIIQSVRSALRAHALHTDDAGEILRLTNHTLWTGSAGDQFAAAAVAVVDPRDTTGTLAAAGMQTDALVLARHAAIEVPPGLPLGVEAESLYQSWPFLIAGDASLVVCVGPETAEQQSVFWETANDALQLTGLSGVRAADIAASLRPATVTEAAPPLSGVVLRAT